MIKNFFILIFIIVYSLGFSQKVAVSLDSVKKKIGSEFKLSIKTETNIKDKVVFPKPGYFGSLEVITIYKTDTVTTQNTQILTKQYGITNFDAGKYVVPKIPILINGKKIYSKELQVEVIEVKVDTLKQKMYDIKEITAAPRVINWWLVALIVGILSLIAALLYKYIKNYKKVTVKPEKVEVISPLEKATQELIKLDKKGLLEKEDAKNYYSELTNIARKFIEEAINIPALERTSAELIESLKTVSTEKKLNLSPEIISNFENVLIQADLVKFAKVKPQKFQIENDKKIISNTIISIYKSIPVEEEKINELDLWNEEQKEKNRIEKLKKIKRKRIVYASAAIVSIVSILFMVLIASKGFEFVKDTILGHPTKELLNSEWITSEYGNPSIKIETPKVLVRTDISNLISKKDQKQIKELQAFSYGSIIGDYYIALGTFNYKQAVTVDLENAIDGIIKNFEQQGAKNIFVKSEEYNTEKGISGKKAYGTFTTKDSKERARYQVLLFAQKGGFQNIIIVHKDNDEVANEITERILNSVELKLAQ